jgi:hypothetical protein
VGAFADRMNIVEDKVELVIGLGAAFYLKENPSFLTRFLFLNKFFQWCGLHYLTTDLLYYYSKYFNSIFVPLARYSMDMKGSSLDETRISIVCSFFPAYSSMKIYD